MCSIILRTGTDGVLIGANRDEMVARSWEAPAEYWPGITGGRDILGGGTWMALNRHGVMAAVLNRHGSLGPAPGKRSRGELPLLALRETSAAAAAERLSQLDAGAYRSFNLVLADMETAYLLRGLEAGTPLPQRLEPGTTMLTSGEPNDTSLPRIARHLPKFTMADFTQWGTLLADRVAALGKHPQHPRARRVRHGVLVPAALRPGRRPAMVVRRRPTPHRPVHRRAALGMREL